MKNSKFVVLLLMFILQAVSVYSQRRDMILVHGFGDGGQRVWREYENFLTNRLPTQNSVAYPIDYFSGNGVLSGANQVNQGIGNIGNPRSNQNIAIGQSMGGIVVRELDRTQTGQNFGGLITLGSPNRGGAIINALQTGALQAELNNGCDQLSKSIGASFFAIGINSGGVGGAIVSVLGGAVVAFKNLLCDFLLGLVTADLPTNTAPNTARDLADGSEVLNTLNNANTPTFKIGVYGVEESPVHMRVLSSLKNHPYERPLASTLAECNTDQELVNTFHEVTDVFTTLGVIFGTIAIVEGANAWWNWSLIFTAIVNGWASYECFNSVSWLNNSESRWHQIIGAGGFYYEQRSIRMMTDDCRHRMEDALDWFEGWTIHPRRRLTYEELQNILIGITENPRCYENVMVNVGFPINNESDGLFNAGTQRIPEDPLDDRHVVNLRVEGVNHAEFFNHRNMTDKFRDIFAGNTNAAQFFRTR